MTADTFWTNLKATGWLKYVPAKMEADQQERLAATLKKEVEHAYVCLATVNIDTQCIDSNHALPGGDPAAFGTAMRPLRCHQHRR